MVKLPLAPAELWAVHHVLFHRMDRARRRKAAREPPPAEAISALGKIERGDCWFTRPELQSIQAELRHALATAPGRPPDRATVERIVRRIGVLLASDQPHQSFSAGRRTRPR